MLDVTSLWASAVRNHEHSNLNALFHELIYLRFGAQSEIAPESEGVCFYAIRYPRLDMV